jgi:hypothetical protein
MLVLTKYLEFDCGKAGKCYHHKNKGKKWSDSPTHTFLNHLLYVKTTMKPKARALFMNSPLSGRLWNVFFG